MFINFAQDKDLKIDQHLKARDEIHRKLIEKFFYGLDSDKDLFTDMEKLMDDMMKSAPSSHSFITSSDASFSMEWTEKENGRVLEVTPKNPQEQLDISVTEEMISIKGKVEEKTSQGTRLSSFSNSFSVPSDCDGSKVKMEQKDSKIIMYFPYRSGLTDKNSEPTKVDPKDIRKPLPPSQTDIEI